MTLLTHQQLDIEFNPDSLYLKPHRTIRMGGVEGTSEEVLRSILNKGGDIPHSLSSQFLFAVSGTMEDPVFYNVLAELYPDKQFATSGIMMYPAGGFMGWHTNSNKPGLRCYFTHSEEDDTNIFRYYDVEQDKVIDSYDKKGWNFRSFMVDKDDLFWHAVICESVRTSIGFISI